MFLNIKAESCKIYAKLGFHVSHSMYSSSSLHENGSYGRPVKTPGMGRRRQNLIYKILFSEPILEKGKVSEKYSEGEFKVFTEGQ